VHTKHSCIVSGAMLLAVRLGRRLSCWVHPVTFFRDHENPWEVRLVLTVQYFLLELNCTNRPLLLLQGARYALSAMHHAPANEGTSQQQPVWLCSCLGLGSAQDEIEYSLFSLNIDPDALSTLYERVEGFLRNPRKLLALQRNL